jgi:hypothetical protein
MSLNQSNTLSALQPSVPQVPLLLHPLGEQLPPDLVPHDEHPIFLIFIYIGNPTKIREVEELLVTWLAFP